MSKRTISCVKWLLAFLNFLFLIFGLVVCSLATWMFVSPSKIQTIFGSNLSAIIAYILIGCGGIIVLISFCGCAGAGLENRCLLCFFFTVLCGIFVASLVSAILIVIFRKDLANLTRDRLSENLKNNYGDINSKTWTDFWDLIQRKFSCCAVEDNKSFVIYQQTPWYKISKPSRVPNSCCKLTETGSFINLKLCQTGNKNSIYTTGCMPAIIKFVDTKAIIILMVLISLAVCLFLSMILSLVHLRNIIYVRYYDYSHPV